MVKTVVDYCSVLRPHHGAGDLHSLSRWHCASSDYRKHGQFEWTGAAILFVCLIFAAGPQLHLEYVGIWRR